MSIILLYLRRMLIDGFLVRLQKNVKGQYRVSYCSRYLAAVAVVAILMIVADTGEYFMSSPVTIASKFVVVIINLQI